MMNVKKTQTTTPINAKSILPHPLLAGWVSHYCLLQGDVDPALPAAVQTIYPCESSAMILQLGRPVDYLAPSGKWTKRATGFVEGQFHRPFQLRFSGRVKLICVWFKPGRAHQFIRDSQSTINNRFENAADVLGRPATELLERCHETSDLRPLKELIDQFLLARLPAANDKFDSFWRAIDQIKDSGGTMPIERVAHSSGLSIRTTERTFGDLLGMTPKQFSRIIRFRSFLRQSFSCPHERLTTLALECGYFDQAHLIHEFREFTGKTPSQFWGESQIVEATTTHERSLLNIL